MNPSPAVIAPGELAFRRVRNGWILRARACDIHPEDDSQHMVEVVFEDEDSDMGAERTAQRLIWHLFEGWHRQKYRGGLCVSVVPHGRAQPCPRCFVEGGHAADCDLAR